MSIINDCGYRSYLSVMDPWSVSFRKTNDLRMRGALNKYFLVYVIPIAGVHELYIARGDGYCSRRVYV